MFRVKSNTSYKSSLALVEKVIRVYSSCTTLEQLAMADSYSELALKRLLKIVPRYVVDTYALDFKRLHMHKYSSNLLIW